MTLTTKEQIINLLDKKVEKDEIIKLIKKKGVNFKLNRQITTELTRIGASDKVFDAIENNHREKVQPINNELKPLTFQQVLYLLHKKVEQEQIIKQVKKYRVNFYLDRQKTVILVRAGAGDELLTALEEYSVFLIITFPRENEPCGAWTRVEGRSTIIQDKYLWVFAHRADLTNQWWPQSGRVKVNKNGKWLVGVNLGDPQDIGFPFEIITIWVTEKVHVDLKNYLKISSETSNYPPMPLPEDSPTYKVTVKKVRH